MTSTQTLSFESRTTSTGAITLAPFAYEVPIDPMDELQCESCQ